MSRSCVVCDAYPGHRGTHYSALEISARLFALRVRAPADKQWAVLPNCFNNSGQPIAATARMPDNPEAHAAGPCWLCEQTDDLEKQVFADEGNGGRSGRSPEANRVTGPLPQEPAHKGDMSMATAPEPRGVLRWSRSGLEVHVCALSQNGNGTPGVEHLKAALREYAPATEVKLTVTETLGSGEAWVTVATAPGQQGALLVCTGQIIDHLVAGGVYGEVVVADA